MSERRAATRRRKWKVAIDLGKAGGDYTAKVFYVVKKGVYYIKRIVTRPVGATRRRKQ